jgi:hypothetical protein
MKMDYRILGKSKLKVSRLCFGSLTIGPLQAKLGIREGVDVISAAFDMGVNFIDTAELYETYEYINKAIMGRRDKIVISSKCYAYTREGAEKRLANITEQITRIPYTPDLSANFAATASIMAAASTSKAYTTHPCRIVVCSSSNGIGKAMHTYAKKPPDLTVNISQTNKTSIDSMINTA